MLAKISIFLFALFGVTSVSSSPCKMIREITPCTCRPEAPNSRRCIVECSEMISFAMIIDTLRDRFPKDQDISLRINYSQLDDMKGRTFEELRMNISHLNLSYNNLSLLHEESFVGLERVEYLSLGDNNFQEVPSRTLLMMPLLKTLDLSRNRISVLRNEDLKVVPALQHLLLPSNEMSKIESNAIPVTIKKLHLGRNSLRHLNGSLRGLIDLEWLFINTNNLTSLVGQLPFQAPKLYLIAAEDNQLQSLPIEVRNYPILDSLFSGNNEIASLGGLLKKSKRCKRLVLPFNNIQTLAEDEFSEAESMEEVQLQHNKLRSLNRAFLMARTLRLLNLTHNLLEEFSFQEIRGILRLKILDLSYNRITHLVGIENGVEQDAKVEELWLDHNNLSELGGSLMGVYGIKKLSLSHNKLRTISPDYFIGLEDLTVLDLSYNYLLTLEELSKTFLPHLIDLNASHNKLTSLHNDFHGLPILCTANLSFNKIKDIGRDLISNTRCSGVLRVYLYDNPVVCSDDFNSTSEYMGKNSTLLIGDFSICPPRKIITITTTTTTVAPMEPIVHFHTSEDLRKLNQIKHPEVLPLTVDSVQPYATKNDSKEQENGEELENENSTVVVHTVVDNTSLIPPQGSNNDSGNYEEPRQETETFLKQSKTFPPNVVVMQPPIVLTDERNQVKLVNPIKYGVIQEDEKNTGEINVNLTGILNPIELVEIRQLPEDNTSIEGISSDQIAKTKDEVP